MVNVFTFPFGTPRFSLSSGASAYSGPTKKFPARMRFSSVHFISGTGMTGLVDAFVASEAASTDEALHTIKQTVIANTVRIDHSAHEHRAPRTGQLFSRRH